MNAVVIDRVAGSGTAGGPAEQKMLNDETSPKHKFKVNQPSNLSLALPTSAACLCAPLTLFPRRPDFILRRFHCGRFGRAVLFARRNKGSLSSMHAFCPLAWHLPISLPLFLVIFHDCSCPGIKRMYLQCYLLCGLAAGAGAQRCAARRQQGVLRSFPCSLHPPT